jgi:hypothetical protein|uniref:outer membrane beta-barrel protein n=1 Tax=uncultured Sphingomonas sp. TaxID=158754 RepID=UPI0035CAD984
MVLIRRIALLALLAPGFAGTAAAQDLPPAAPLLEVPESLFLPTSLTIGGAPVQIGGAIRFEYDSNIYAQATNPVDDEKLLFRPYVAVLPTPGRVQFSGIAEGDIRKFVGHRSEDAAGGNVHTTIAWMPSSTDTVALVSGWQHVIEDRGEPEGLTTRTTGPRQLDIIDADLSYAKQGPRLGFSLRGTAAASRYTAAIDRNRNLNTFSLVGRTSYRLGPVVNTFVEGFVTNRDFVVAPSGEEAQGDAHTYGGRLGISLDPGGALHGEVGAGIYRFRPDAPQRAGRNGLSVQAALVFSPWARAALTLDGFVGDVATFQTGAQSRQDQRIRIGVQQEVLHNFRWQTSLVYRRSRYYGTSLTDTIYGAIFEADYAINRRTEVGLLVRYATRDSTAPLSEYSRLRIGIDLKGHY